MLILAFCSFLRHPQKTSPRLKTVPEKFNPQNELHDLGIGQFHKHHYLREIFPNGKSDQSQKRLPQDKNNIAHPEEYAKP